MAELCVKGSLGPTIGDIRNWPAGGEKENLQIMADEEMINNVLEDDSSENEEESSTLLIIRTIRYDDATSVFNTCYKWAEENNLLAEDILTLKRLQEKVLKEAFRNKKWKSIDAFFFKNTVK
jgi:hypothetical protein